MIENKTIIISIAVLVGVIICVITYTITSSIKESEINKKQNEIEEIKKNYEKRLLDTSKEIEFQQTMCAEAMTNMSNMLKEQEEKYLNMIDNLDNNRTESTKGVVKERFLPYII